MNGAVSSQPEAGSSSSTGLRRFHAFRTGLVRRNLAEYPELFDLFTRWLPAVQQWP
jgi:hypothetical protein